jgi:hypothetical protein
MGHTLGQRLATLATCTFFAASGLTAAAVATATTSVSAATSTVTETNLCGGAGSFKTLLDQANANPGPDTIEFTAGLRVQAWTCNLLNSGIVGYPLMTTGPLTIVGNGATVLGGQVYISANGQVNDPNQCPSRTAGTMIAEPSIGLLEVGDYDVDNTGVTVTVSDLHFDGMPSLFLVEKNATLTFTDSKVEGTLSFNGSCNRAPIEVREGNLHLEYVEFHRSSAPELDQYNAATTLSVVAGYQAGALTMDHVTMSTNFVGRAVYWQGTSAKIASSQFYDSGGLWLATPTSQVVNSVIWSNSTHATDRIVSTVRTGPRDRRHRLVRSALHGDRRRRRLPEPRAAAVGKPLRGLHVRRTDLGPADQRTGRRRHQRDPAGRADRQPRPRQLVRRRIHR